MPLASRATSPDAAVQVAVSLSRDTIGLDEHTILAVEVSGEDQNLPAPNMPTLPMFEIYSQGRSSNVSIVNGQVTASVTYRFMLLPSKAGTYQIRNIAVVHKNRRYNGNAVDVTVIDAGVAPTPELSERATDSKGNNRDYFMEAVVDNTKPFVNEQVTLTLKLHFAVQMYGSPELTEPTTTGFWTEVLGNKAPYYQRINGRNYKVIERKYALFPTQTGKLTIGRAMITATVAGNRRARDAFDLFGMFGRGEQVTIRSRPIEIQVQPLPEKGRPRDFTGTIGRFNVSASANRTEVEVNQPVSVTYRINGVGNIKSVAEPSIPESDDFRVYKASSSENITKLNDKIGGTKIFEEVFMPKKPGTLIIPAITFSFFNPDREKYEVAQTSPIRVTVQKPEGYVAGADVPYTEPDMSISARASEIRFIKQDMGDLRPVGQLILFSPIYMVVNALPVALMVGLAVARRRRERLTSDVGYARSRAASRMARKRLSKAKSLATVETTEPFFAELSLALTSYVADKLNISPHGLTSESLADLLRDRSAEEELVTETLRFLQECDFARFAPASVTREGIDQALRSAEEIIVRIEGVRFGKH
jgi:hypothetical protein